MSTPTPRDAAIEAADRIDTAHFASTLHAVRDDVVTLQNYARATDPAAGGDLAALRELHVQAPAPDEMFCAECGNGWPCRSARLLAAAPASETAIEGEGEGLCPECLSIVPTVLDEHRSDVEDPCGGTGGRPACGVRTEPHAVLCTKFLGHDHGVHAPAATPRAEGEAGGLRRLVKRWEENGQADAAFVAIERSVYRAVAADLRDALDAHRCAPPAPEVVSRAEAAALLTVDRVAEVCEAAGLALDGNVWRDDAVDVLAVTSSCTPLCPGDDGPLVGIFVGPEDETRREDLSPHASATLLRAAIDDVRRSAPPPLAVGDVVETAADLDRLPVGTSVALSDGDIGKRYAPGWAWVSGPVTGASFPARVLDLPTGGAS